MNDTATTASTYSQVSDDVPIGLYNPPTQNPHGEIVNVYIGHAYEILTFADGFKDTIRYHN